MPRTSSATLDLRRPDRTHRGGDRSRTAAAPARFLRRAGRRRGGRPRRARPGGHAHRRRRWRVGDRHKLPLSGWADRPLGAPRRGTCEARAWCGRGDTERGGAPARAEGANHISLHAQAHARSLYLRGGYAEWALRGGGDRARPWTNALPELRIDPLSGLKVVVAGERGARPGAWLDVPSRAPIDREADLFGEATVIALPELYAAPGRRRARLARGGEVRVVPNLYPRSCKATGRLPTIRWRWAAATPTCSRPGRPTAHTSRSSTRRSRVLARRAPRGAGRDGDVGVA